MKDGNLKKNERKKIDASEERIYKWLLTIPQISGIHHVWMKRTVIEWIISMCKLICLQYFMRGDDALEEIMARLKEVEEE